MWRLIRREEEAREVDTHRWMGEREEEREGDSDRVSGNRGREIGRGCNTLLPHLPKLTSPPR